jgi:hypothetical protein
LKSKIFRPAVECVDPEDLEKASYQGAPRAPIGLRKIAWPRSN